MTARERITSACIEDYDVKRVLLAIHLIEHPIQVYSFIFVIGLDLYIGINWNQIIAARNLHPVARVVEQSYSTT